MSNQKLFYQVLINNLLANFTNFYIWFALTFWVYLETKSVLAVSWVGGIFIILNLISSLYFGHIVDHHRKEVVMRYSSLFSLGFYLLGAIIFFSFADSTWSNQFSPLLWLLIVMLMIGSIVGNLRSIALSTTVTLLFSTDRDKANGQIGISQGLAMVMTSVFSGVTIGLGGMGAAIIITLVGTVLALIHLLFVHIPETLTHHEDVIKPKLNPRETLSFILAVPGLMSLLIFNTMNNFLGGVFMALMDAYGLSLVSVENWGLMWGVASLSFIIGGLVVSKFGIGKNPLQTILILNTVSWAVCIIFPIQASVVLLMIGMLFWLTLSPVIEAAEQTLLQSTVPKEQQGRVFGFAQSMESSATPLTAFLIGPITHFFFIPFMTTGAGVNLIGDWFGTGADRGIALVFVITGLVGTALTLIAFKTKAYQLLSRHLTSRQTPINNL